MKNPYLNQSISSATLKTEDLISAFVPVYESLDGVNSESVNLNVLKSAKKYDSYFSQVNAGVIPANTDFEEEISEFLNDVLFDELNRFAPEGFYFGAHMGDGSDFGYWEIDCE